MASDYRKTRARAPLRLGLAGGGTDLSPFCDRFGGAVLNATIERYAFASILPRTDGKVCFQSDDIGYSETFEIGQPMADARLLLHRGVYERMVADFGGGDIWPMTIKTTVDAPAGSGLGSSSALVVALVDAFREVMGAPLGKYDVAHLAFEIERIDLGLAGGRQDQYAAAFGGINFIEFLADDRVIVNPLRVSEAVVNELESSLVVCFSGRSRASAEIIDRQQAGLNTASAKTIDAMQKLKIDAVEMKRALLVGNLRRMADILNESWKAKQATATGVSTDRIDELFRIAFKHGAEGGKVSGAGGGGFMFFMVQPENRYSLLQALNDAGGQSSPVKFNDVGSQAWQL
ncbi:GHMP kinase [Zavarzinia compransoris]|uniref:GHMP family kinase ATP-binding protein n=1 Tax=Zavarzinia marina TaxID=2911065 RepID=UPI001F1DCC1E|nr:GHMP kinase [Zavarzinia marina]MCF4167259.1 GHMP kinase [Zavarzinia marina]